MCFAFTPPHRVAQSASKAIPHSTVNHFRRLRHCPTDLTPNMGFLDLPSEVFERIVMHLATHDGVVEAWKHHKVSRTCISPLSPHPEYAMTVSKGVNEVSKMERKESCTFQSYSLIAGHKRGRLYGFTNLRGPVVSLHHCSTSASFTTTCSLSSLMSTIHLSIAGI